LPSVSSFSVIQVYDCIDIFQIKTPSGTLSKKIKPVFWIIVQYKDKEDPGIDISLLKSGYSQRT